MLADDFVLTLLTYNPRKAQSIQTLLARRALPALVRIVTIPEMAHIPGGGTNVR